MQKYFRNNRSLLSKVDFIRHLCNEAIGDTSNEYITKMLGRLRLRGTEYVKKYGEIHYTNHELILDQLLRSNEISPRSAYRWFILLRAPKKLIERVEQGELSIIRLEKECQTLRRKDAPQYKELEEKILKQIMGAVRSL